MIFYGLDWATTRSSPTVGPPLFDPSNKLIQKMCHNSFPFKISNVNWNSKCSRWCELFVICCKFYYKRHVWLTSQFFFLYPIDLSYYMIAMSDFSASSIRLVICFRKLRFKLHFTTQSGYLGFRSGVPHIPNPVPIINGDKIMSQTINRDTKFVLNLVLVIIGSLIKILKNSTNTTSYTY